MNEEQKRNNDLAVAKELNEILYLLVDTAHKFKDQTDRIYMLSEPYIILADSIKKLYEANVTLSEIEPESLGVAYPSLKNALITHWKDAVVDKMVFSKISEVFSTHIAGINRLWILAGKPKPVFDDRTIQNLIDACAAIDQLTTEATISFRPESYTLTYTNGRDIYINDLKIKSTNVVSGATTFLDEIFDNKNILFIPNLGSPHRSIHALINDIGVKGETKKMFFPKSDKTQVLFRPTISRKEIIREKINTDELDKRFRENSKS